MHDEIEELYARWQRNPDATQTTILCDALRSSNRADLVEIVGSHASRQLDPRALIAAARMYAAMGRLADAQVVLLNAGHLAPHDANVYRWLGDILLQQGDAERAEKVLVRAAELGGADREVHVLLDRARSMVATQHAPRSERNGGQYGSRPLPSFQDDDEAETQIRKDHPVRAALAASSRVRPAAGSAAGSVDLALAAPPQTAGVRLPADRGLPASSSTLPFAVGLPAAPPPSSRRRSIPPPLPDARRASAPPVPPPLLAVPRAVAPEGPRVPEPRDVLEALQIAGVFEPDGAVRSQDFAWNRPERGRRRVGSYVTLFVVLALFVSGGAGAFTFVKQRRAKEATLAEAMLTKVDADLRASDERLLKQSETALARSFELDSRSPHAALTWLHERAMVGLLKSGEDLAFEDAAQRARDVGVDEGKIAFAYVASFLFQGDTAGAAANIAKWDAKASGDAWYQLLAGATFERAGDARALERYEAAATLDPELLVAHILFARASAVDGEPQKAETLAKAFQTKHPERAESAALSALAWARNPARGDPPPEIRLAAERVEGLPRALAAVPHAARAMLALGEHDAEGAKTALQKGLGVADTPGVASWLGSIALSTGDEQLARSAALKAVSYSAVYPPARVLAARVALLGARLDEALKASEDLPATSADVAIVTAAAGYEKVDGELVARALEGLDEETRKLPPLVPITNGHALLLGRPVKATTEEIVRAAEEDAPWADLVAIDQALDTGQLDAASKIAAQWAQTKDESRPLRAVRLARLARYLGKMEEAEANSAAALTGATVTLRALGERVFTLVAAGKASEALALFKAYPNTGGPTAKWLRAYAAASAGKLDEAKAIIAQEDPPPALAPAPARMIAAAAYGAVKDARHGKDYTKALVQAGFLNPDMIVAGERVGLGKLGARRR